MVKCHSLCKNIYQLEVHSILLESVLSCTWNDFVQYNQIQWDFAALIDFVFIMNLIYFSVSLKLLFK